MCASDELHPANILVKYLKQLIFDFSSHARPSRSVYIETGCLNQKKLSGGCGHISENITGD